MAYNLESLVKILEQILYPDHRQPWILDADKKSQVETLLEKVSVLNKFFENSSPVANDEVRRLESRIRDAVYDAEDAIESHLKDRLLSRADSERYLISPPDLLQAIAVLDLVVEETTKIMDGIQQRGNALTSTPVSSSQGVNRENIVVGMSEDLMKLKDRLIGGQRKLEIIPIVGMGGIGKTTLAQSIYSCPPVVSHFDIRAWIVISQSYNVQEILLGLLQSLLGKSMDEINEKKTDEEKIKELGLRLHKTLWGRRYFIVLDDMWNSKAWDDIKMFFPDDGNQSRIVVTTRECDVAEHVDPLNLHHRMNFLNAVESWNLLCTKLFANEPCPSDLEEVGESIVKDCGGLPLALHVIGGVLSNLDRTPESWIQVANDVRSAVAKKDEFSSILSLSYNHLPNHLKSCFLYLSGFPEDSVIRASKLVRMLVAEGFLKPILGKSMEEAAKVYLKELSDRNLLSVHRQEIKGNVKSYIMHDLLRELCIRKAREEHFLCFATGTDLENLKSLAEDKIRLRRLSAHNYYACLVPIMTSTDRGESTRSFLYCGRTMKVMGSEEMDFLCKVLFRLDLIKVLDIANIQFFELPQPLQRLVNLRYLVATSWHTHLSPWIRNLQYLQSLVLYMLAPSNPPVIRGYLQLLWCMPRLRHIKFKGRYIRYSLKDGDSIPPQEDLQTLCTVVIDHKFPEILQAMPNLKKLGIFCGEDTSLPSVIDLTCLSKLEALKCISQSRSRIDGHFLEFLRYPPFLKRLTISRCAIPDGHLNEIGSLPNLEVLKLKKSTFGSDRVLKPSEGKFGRLRLLILKKLNLVEWIADESHYPRLESLVIQDCSELEEIPSGIGDIPTLETIEVRGASSASMLESARIIEEERIDLGNNTPQVRINAYVGRAPRSPSPSDLSPQFNRGMYLDIGF